MCAAQSTCASAVSLAQRGTSSVDAVWPVASETPGKPLTQALNRPFKSLKAPIPCRSDQHGAKPACSPPPLLFVFAPPDPIMESAGVRQSRSRRRCQSREGLARIIHSIPDPLEPNCGSFLKREPWFHGAG